MLFYVVYVTFTLFVHGSLNLVSNSNEGPRKQFRLNRLFRLVLLFNYDFSPATFCKSASYHWPGPNLFCTGSWMDLACMLQLGGGGLRATTPLHCDAGTNDNE